MGEGEVVLVLGAGRVSKPCVAYLSAKTRAQVVVADRDGDNLARIEEACPGVKTIEFDASNGILELLERTKPALVLNLLPANLVSFVAKECVEHGTSMINVSYKTDEISELDPLAREKNLLLLCEMGLDPGIDHMLASQTAREIHQKGGQVIEFSSYCGAIPSPESNNNPFGYKISWSPYGLANATRREARALRNGEVIVYPPGEVFRHPFLTEIEGLGWFEVYPNGNAISYVDLYGIPEVKSIYRGTIRYAGWCETTYKMLKMGLFDDKKILQLGDKSYREFTSLLLGIEPSEDLEEALCERLNLEPYSLAFQKLKWLGLLDEERIPLKVGTPCDVVVDLMARKLRYERGEKDMVVMENRFTVNFGGEQRTTTITMVDEGTVGEETSIARTTGLPAAIAARLFLEGKIARRGVTLPTCPEIYEPSLRELRELGITFQRRDKPLKI